MGLTLTSVYSGVVGDRRKVVKSVAFDSSYPTGGESLTAADFGLTVIDYVEPSFSAGYSLVWAPSTSKLLAYWANNNTGDITANTGALDDDDNAASTGVALYAAPTENGVDAFFTSTTAGNADTTFRVGASGPTAFVFDDDTPAGAPVYFDEDAASTDSRFLATTATGADQFVTLSDGSKIKITYHADPGTPGVPVYLDDDAASAHLKLMFVSPTNVNGSYTTDDTVSEQTVAGTDAALVEVTASTSLTGISAAIVTAYGY